MTGLGVVVARLVAVIALAASGCASAPAPVSAPTATSSPSRPCDAAFADGDFAELFDDLQRVAEVDPVWPSFDTRGLPLVLEARTATGACVAHVADGRVLATAHTDAPIENSLGVFGILITARADAAPAERMGFLAGGVPEVVLRSLRDAGVRAALVWSGNAETLSAAGLGEPATRARVARYLLLHESFHVQALFGPVFAPGWPRIRPEWMVQADQEALTRECLGDPAATRERAILADAVAAGEADDLPRMREGLRTFAEARAARYRRLAAVRLAAGEAELPCWVAESVWELDEGGADHASLVTLAEAGLAAPHQPLSDYVRGDTDNAPYYHTGAAQLFVLGRLAPARGALFTELQTAEAPTGALWCAVVEATGVPFEPCAGP
ncbi:MAG: hypothetical protein CMN30_07985 [Sandaracinus sp.]|nr:hypothetical protein [Sandaracinus sp.]